MNLYTFTHSLAISSLLSCLLFAAGCSDDSDVCDPMKDACLLEQSLSVIELAAGEEEEDTCQSWTLNNPTELWVTGITQRNDSGYHHANWFFVPDDTFVNPDGAWSCSAQDFSELEAAILGGYLFAMSTQSQEETQTLPSGSAIRIPPYSRIIGASHLLNATDQPIMTEMRLALATIPPEDVQAKMVPGRITYHDLNLEPQSVTSFTTECVIDETYEQMMGEPMEMELYYALSHYHELGRWAQLEIAGGPNDGQVLFRADGYGENFGKAFDPPFDLVAAGGRGLRFTCGFDNPRDAFVNWGIGDQEMCVLALQSRTNMGFDAIVNNGTGERVGVTAEGEVQYQGPCSMLGIPWNHDKRGGPPR